MSNSMKAMRVVREVFQSFCIVLLLLTCCARSAQNERSSASLCRATGRAWCWLQKDAALHRNDHDRTGLHRQRYKSKRN
jgi:hypothetical protein